MKVIEYVTRIVYAAALSFFPRHLDSPEARALLTAIALQGSGLRDRMQHGSSITHSLWAFDIATLRAALTHSHSKPFIGPVLSAMGYDQMPTTSYEAIKHNDVLACCYARALLCTHPQPLPKQDETELAWSYYFDLWRPGMSGRQAWPHNFETAWRAIGGHR